MKKYLIGSIAFISAIAFSAFRHTSQNIVGYVFEYNDAAGFTNPAVETEGNWVYVEPYDSDNAPDLCDGVNELPCKIVLAPSAVDEVNPGEFVMRTVANGYPSDDVQIEASTVLSSQPYVLVGSTIGLASSLPSSEQVSNRAE